MKFKNVCMGLAVILAVSCGSKEEKKETGTQAATQAAAKAPELKDASALLIRSWKLEDLDASAAEGEIPEKSRAEFKKMVAGLAATAKTNTVYTFEEGGKAKTTTLDYNNKWHEYEGTWILSGDKKTLTITTNGKPDKMEISNLTESSLDLYSDEAKMKMKFIAKQ